MKPPSFELEGIWKAGSPLDEVADTIKVTPEMKMNLVEYTGK